MDSGFLSRCGITMQFGGRICWRRCFHSNVGVEIGQVAVLLALIPALDALFRFAIAGTHGNDYSFGNRRTYRMALDAGSGKRSGQIPIRDAALGCASFAGLVTAMVNGGSRALGALVVHAKPVTRVRGALYRIGRLFRRMAEDEYQPLCYIGI